MSKTLPLLCLLLTSPALAKGFQGRPALLAPSAPSPLRLERVDFVIEGARAEASYAVFNPTAKALVVQLTLPNSPFPCTSNDCAAPEIYRVPAVTGGAELMLTSEHPWAKDVKAVWATRVEVAAGARQTVSVRFSGVHVRYAEGTSGISVTELLVPPKWTWAGPIGEARLSLRGPRVWGGTSGPWLDLVASVERVGKKGGVAELVFRAKAVQPKEAFRFIEDREPWVSHGTCAALLVGQHRGVEERHTRPADTEPPTTEVLLARMDSKTLRRCRNLPYALHGYAFKSADLRKQYSPLKPNEFGLHLNPAFHESLLTAKEGAFIRLVKAEEARRKKAP